MRFLWSRIRTVHVSYKDWKAVLACIGVSLFFWVSIKLESTYSTNMKVPLKFHYSYNNIMVTKPLPAFVEVNVSGVGYELLKKLMGTLKSIHFRIENPLKTKFQTVKSIRPELDEILKDFQVNYILQDTIFTFFDTIVSKELYVAVNSNSILLDEGYQIISPIHVSPPTLTVVGPKKTIDLHIDTVWLSIEDELLSSSFQGELKPQINLHDYQTLIPAHVEVSFEVAYFYHVELPARLHFINFPENRQFQATPTEAKVQYSMRQDIYEDYEKPDSMNIYLDFLEYNEVDSTICASYLIDTHFEYIQSLPEFFTIILN